METLNTSDMSNIMVNSHKYVIKPYDSYYWCVDSSDKMDIIDNINIMLSNSTIISIDCIKNIILKCQTNIKNEIINTFIDKYNIFNIQTISKYKINKNELEINFSKKYIAPNIQNIPKELKLSEKQLFGMLIGEIENVNSNISYPHYIVCTDDIMTLYIRFAYKSGELGYKLSKLNEKFGYDYIELKLELSSLYPFMPPNISYIKPKVDIDLINNIINLDLWNISTWNYTITLEWIVKNLAIALEPHFNKYIDFTNELNSIDKEPLNFIELKLLELNKISKIKPQVNIPIDLQVFNFSNTTSSNSKSYFKSGTGYGNSNQSEWNISQHIDIIKTNEINTCKILENIFNYLKISNGDYIINSTFYDYIITKLCNINLLNFNNMLKTGKILIDILDIIYTKYINKSKDKSIYKLFIQNLVKGTNDLFDEIKFILNTDTSINAINQSHMCIYLFFIDTIQKYQELDNIINVKDICSIQKTNISEDIKLQYIEMVNKYKYGIIVLEENHLYHKMKTNMISPKSIMRIMSELASLKKDLPINWDSSVLLRIIPSNTNLITFLITGPKDTPYHNGIFEFHAYFPNDYPASVPQVLLNTTDGGKVRFNPNLYANGKVCLSLLGTWSAQKGESWIPEISTFFQVILSIQSLIFVDEPYFNEPGYEKSIGSKDGIKYSFEYNENIRYYTIKVAMIGIIKNSISGYDEFIKNHFKFKKDEILETVNKWYNETVKIKAKMKETVDELTSLLNTL